MKTKFFTATLSVTFFTTLIWTSVSQSKEQKAEFLGHLLTPTTYTLEKNTVTAGSHIVSYSPNDKLMVGTASFLALFYNTPNLFLKYGRDINEKSRWALQFDYFKSSKTKIIPNSTFYEMEGVMLWGLWSRDFTPSYTIHLSLNYMYFINEGKPHSLRREPFNDQPFQFSLTSLHEVKITERFGVAAEIGILGLNYTLPNIHLGTTFRYTGRNYLVQVGFSIDRHLFSSDKASEYASENEILDLCHTVSALTHPELGFQYFF